MADLGVVTQAVNAKQMQLYIGAASANNEWKLVQNARVMISHPIFREPTTGGGVVTYTGAPDHSISGSLLFTRDEWNDGTTNDISSLITIANGEVPLKSWVIKFTDTTGTSTNATLTFTNCKLSVVDISKSAEGGVKADITIVCPDEPGTT
mgnify:CR=1 FL=1